MSRAERSIGILGGDGFIGSEVINRLEGRFQIDAPKNGVVDITKLEMVEAWVNGLSSNVVFLFAAYTDVKGAQENPDLARKINVQGVENVGKIARKKGKYVVYLSTGFVYTGRKDFIGPYSEDDDPHKCKLEDRGVYAQTKLEGEDVLLSLDGLNHLIIRIDYPYGNQDFPNKDYLIKLVNQAKTIPLFSDQQVTPTYIPDLCKVLEYTVSERPTGILHVASRDATSPYELGKKVVETLGLQIDVKSSSVFDYLDSQTTAGKKVLWPLEGGLRVDKVEKLIGSKMMTTEESLDDFLPRLETVLAKN